MKDDNYRLSDKDITELEDIVKDTGLLYHVSPKKLKVLSGKASKTPGAYDYVFVTPKKVIARMMAPSNQLDIVEPIEKQLGKKHIPIFNIGYDYWGDPQNAEDEIKIKVSTPEEFKPFKGKTKAYLYAIALNKIKSRLKKWQFAPRDTTNEYLVSGDIEPDSVERITVPFSVRKDENGYQRPYGALRLKQLGLEHLLKDPVHKWRAVTGLELIHREPDKEELERIYKNWLKMPERAKHKSDRKSMELFGKNNEDHYRELLKLY